MISGSYVVNLQCDQPDCLASRSAGEGNATFTATTQAAAIAQARRWGWRIGRVSPNGRTRDLCPDCAAFQESAPVEKVSE